ncbi:hypothetical protein GR328_14585 [Microvirga makkahensis]|uniref:Nucleotidyltransferase family protein n=2 Tax=Microvirga makkahensis TaxID=1128670 RepID=A0A7X3SPP4_9HYPH|nr:hypothetical protein [Microvirga makkahensis]
MISDSDGIVAFLQSRPDMLRILRAVETLGLPDCWVGAGFIRNAVWGALTGQPNASSWDDVDVVYFCRSDLSPSRDQALGDALQAVCPDVKWSVKNQARMHIGNDDQPYTDTEDALRHWPECCTAIAARCADRTIALLAPFGLDDLLSMVVRPTPSCASKMGVYRGRVDGKRWQRRWPMLRIDFAPP